MEMSWPHANEKYYNDLNLGHDNTKDMKTNMLRNYSKKSLVYFILTLY